MPGSGKGTQGAVLGQLPSFVHLSMGDGLSEVLRITGVLPMVYQYPVAAALIRIVILAAVCYPLAWLSFRVFEEPILRLKRHFTPGGSRRLAPQTAAAAA